MTIMLKKSPPRYTHNQTNELHKKDYPVCESFLTGPHVTTGPFAVTKLDQVTGLVLKLLYLGFTLLGFSINSFLPTNYR